MQIIHVKVSVIFWNEEFPICRRESPGSALLTYMLWAICSTNAWVPPAHRPGKTLLQDVKGHVNSPLENTQKQHVAQQQRHRSGSASNPGLLLMCSWEARTTPQASTGSLPCMWGPQDEFKASSFRVWPSSNCCRYLGNRPADRRSLFLGSVCLSKHKHKLVMEHAHITQLFTKKA